MAKQYTMRGVRGVANRAVQLACQHLLAVAPGSSLHDVQDDPRFQHRGIDFLWDRGNGDVIGVEVKGDRHARRGTYFFELVSNYEKQTPGCFLYSEAEVYAYVFVETNEVHCLPLPQTRAWFLDHAAEYPVKATQTKTGPITYTTLGSPVPILDVARSVEGVQCARVHPPQPNPPPVISAGEVPGTSL